jgi:plastocyanin
VLAIIGAALAPSSLCQGDPMTVVFTVRNFGGGAANNVSLTGLSQVGTGAINSLAGPSPAVLASLAGLSNASFTYTAVADYGSGAGPWGLAFVARPIGEDQATGQPLEGANISSNAISICALTPTPTGTASPSATPSATPTDSPTRTASASATPTRSATPSFTPTPATAMIVANTSFQWVPNQLTITAGTQVTWAWPSGTHDVRSDTGLFTSGPAVFNGTLAYTFNTPGTYRYYCSLHGGPGGSGMSGIIFVLPLSPTPTPTRTQTPVVSETPSATATATRSVSPSATETATPSVTRTATPTATETATLTATRTATPTASPSPTGTWSVTESPTRTVSASATLTATLSFTPLPGSPTDSPTASPSFSPSPSFTDSPTPTATSTPTPTASPTVTRTATRTATESATPSATLSASPTVTETRTQTETATVSPSFTASPTVTVTPTITVTWSVTPTPNVAKDLLAPVPARLSQPVRLYLNGPDGPCRWRVYNVAGELIADLSFSSANGATWDHAGKSGGVYLVHVRIEAGGGREFWQRLALY